MNKEIVTFSDNKTEKHKFYSYKNPIFLKVVDIDNILMSDNVFFWREKL